LQKLPTTIHQEKLPSQMLNSNRLFNSQTLVYGFGYEDNYFLSTF
ncbi:9837_t:CDS:2, partial [Entrophospora sp. SA101]